MVAVPMEPPRWQPSPYWPTAEVQRTFALVVTEPSNRSFLHAATATTTGDVTGTLRSTEELQEALPLVVAAYRDIGPPPDDDEAVHAWAQQYGYIAYLAEQLTGAGGRFALEQLRELAAERRGNPRR
jgi:hypothetical protein